MAEEKPKGAKEAKEGKRSERRAKPRAKIAVARGKRKAAVARAVVKPGRGRFTVNKVAVQAISQRFVREVVEEPMGFVDPSLLKSVDVEVNVRGGGVAGQAQAARTAVARALVEYTRDESLRRQMMEYDRTILVEDPRRVEPKKYKGPKARARFTKSYR